jgi:hypothetical protein
MSEIDTANKIKFDDERINAAYLIAFGRSILFAAARTRYAQTSERDREQGPTFEVRTELLNQARAAYEIARDDYGIAAAHFQGVVAVVASADDDYDLEKVLEAMASLSLVALGA